LALIRGQGGVLFAPSAYFCKHPLRQFTDDEAFQMIERFIDGTQLVLDKNILRVNEGLRLETPPDLVPESLN
jgi:hypothetical protein